jgi:hypothetical protein
VKKLSIILVFFCLLSVDLLSQDKDFRVWTSINLEKKINSGFSLLFSETVRFTENASRAGTVFSDFGIRYKLKKKWKITGHYRFSKFNNGNNFFSSGHRFYIDIAYRQKTNTPLSFTFRGRYQSQYTDMYTSNNGLIPQKRLRVKATASYDLERRYKPYISGELFYELSDNTEYRNQFVNSRYAAGVVYELNKRNSLDIYYLLIRGMNVPNPNRFHALGLELNHLF